jgi:hypothetical protein
MCGSGIDRKGVDTMKIFTIIKKGITMLIMAAWVLTFAVTPKPKSDKTQTTAEKDKIKIEFVKPEKVDKNDNNSDHFNDPDSNGVNDQRENDLKNIKELKSKHKDNEPAPKDKGAVKETEPKPALPKIKLKKPTR